MSRDLTIFIEGLAFFGLICCLFIYHANVWFLGTLIAFVLCETIMEFFHMKLKPFFSYIYDAVFLIGLTAAAVISNGLHLSSFVPLFFGAILLFISQYAIIIESSNNQMQNDGKKEYGI